MHAFLQPLANRPSCNADNTRRGSWGAFTWFGSSSRVLQSDWRARMVASSSAETRKGQRQEEACGPASTEARKAERAIPTRAMRTRARASMVSPERTRRFSKEHLLTLPYYDFVRTYEGLRVKKGEGVSTLGKGGRENILSVSPPSSSYGGFIQYSPHASDTNERAQAFCIVLAFALSRSVFFSK